MFIAHGKPKRLKPQRGDMCIMLGIIVGIKHIFGVIRDIKTF